MAFPNVVFHTAGFVFSCLIRTTEVFGETIQFPVTYGFLFVLEDIITALIHAHQILVSRFLFFFIAAVSAALYGDWCTAPISPKHTARTEKPIHSTQGDAQLYLVELL